MSMTDTTTEPTRTPPESESAPKGPRRAFPQISFSTQVLIGLALGILLGLVALRMGPAGVAEDGSAIPNWLTAGLQTIGTTFVTLLKAVVPPLIFLAIVSSIANLRAVTNAARLAVQTLVWFGITSLIAVLIGIGLGDRKSVV